MLQWDALTHDEREALHAEQTEMELRAVDDGIRRFRDQCNTQPMSQWSASRKLMVQAIDDVVHGIEEARIAAEQGQGQRGCQGWGIPFLVMDPGTLALATIACCLDNVSIRTDEPSFVSKVIADIGNRIEIEWHFMILKEEAPKLKAVMDRRIKKWNRRSVLRATKSMGDLDQRWKLKMKRQIGAKLLSIILEHTTLLTMKQLRRGRRAPQYVFLSETAASTIANTNEDLEIMQPLSIPMVVPPNDWGPGERGGYQLLSRYYPLVIQSVGAPESMVDHGPQVYAAINSLQRTGWAVNEDILRTIEQVYQAGGGWANLPTVEPETIDTPYPADAGPEQQRQWKLEASLTHERNAKAVGKRLTFLNTVSIARRLAGREIFFPYRYDFRGRVYPTPQFLQPQGNDVARSLLTFSTGKRLGERGFWWLRVHFANCWGVDKVSFDERVAWTGRKLNEWAAMCWEYQDIPDPLDHKDLWAGADKPWQALAALREIGRACMLDSPGDYVCCLPVSVDGSNSGLQHFSAMLRDEHGARLVNLVPSEAPQDIYAVVAKCVKREVEGDAKSEVTTDTSVVDLPRAWLDQGIDRKLCKRGTMTYCYGVTQQGLKDALRTDSFGDWHSDPHVAVQYIGKKIWAAIRENITAAADAMDWLRKCAQCANKEEMLLRWTTPSGFVVEHPYYDAPFARVTCLSAEIRLRVFDPDAKVMEHRQRNALPPNFVHSMDASHLMRVVCAGTQRGIHSWMMIHDSFGSHACDMDLLSLVTREEFVALYSADVLEEFRQQVIEQTGHDPGPPPERGAFQLEQVLDSPYFFA
jgi:DNA-directed RNA polymerase